MGGWNCSYTTSRLLVVKDSPLGWVATALYVAAAIYVASALAFTQKYEEFAPISASIQASLLPLLNINTNDYSYCRDDACRVWDNDDIVYGHTQTTMLVTSNVESWSQEACVNCSEPWKNTSMTQFLIAAADQFQLNLVHTVQAPSLYQRDLTFGILDNLQMKGKLLDINNDVLGSFGKGSSDVLTVSNLLLAAGVTHTEDVRRSGVTIVVTILYDNKDGEPQYTMQAMNIGSTPAELVEVRRSANDNSTRQRLKRTGYYFVFIPVGRFGYISANALFVQLAVFWALLGVSSCFVEVMLRVFGSNRVWNAKMRVVRYRSNGVPEIQEDASQTLKNTLVHGTSKVSNNKDDLAALRDADYDISHHSESDEDDAEISQSDVPPDAHYGLFGSPARRTAGGSRPTTPQLPGPETGSLLLNATKQVGTK